MHETNIKIVDNAFIIKNWADIQDILRLSFQYSSFNSGYSFDKALNEIIECILIKNNQHVIALKNKDIKGCIFSIRPNTNNSEIYYDIGWFFVHPNLNKKEKLFTAISMIEKTHELLRNMNYKFICTEFGTKEGERLIIKKFNYKYTDQGYWLKEL